jgi:tripartite-type tricarboxylate transporter receptor subunit TctC
MRSLMLAAASLLALAPAAAQDYPTKPITIVVPAAAGGPTDTISRVTAQAMSKHLGQQLLIENIGGAGGTIGITRAVRAAPDGYTLLIYHVGLASTHTLYRQLPYNTRTAFAPVGLITDAPMTIIARSDFQPNTLTDFVSYIKGRNTKTTMGNAGVGSASHLCGMLFMSETKIEFTTVPYRGTGPVMNDLIGKQIDTSCDQATNTTGPILGKTIKAYAVTTKTRLKSLPDVPTADEAGMKGFELSVWHGLWAPKGTPSAIVQKLSTALKAALKEPDVIKRFNDISTEPVADNRATPEAAERTLLTEIDRWAPIIKAAGQYAD